MDKTDILHVVPDFYRGHWKLMRSGRSLGTFPTQEWAVTVGRRLARKNRVDLVTHGNDGRIRSKDSYGNESAVRDTEH